MGDMMVSHGACGLRWWQAGNRTGHCSSCHLNFDSLSAFDRHRRDGDCLNPEGATDKNSEPVFAYRLGKHPEDADVGYYRLAKSMPEFWEEAP